MRKFILAAALACLSSAAWAQGVPNSATVVAACGTPPTTYTPGQNKANLQDTAGRQCTAAVNSNASVGPTGSAVPTNAGYVGINQSGNLVGAVAGHGTAAGALRVELPTDGTGQVNAIVIPSSASTAGIAPTSTAALAANLVAKNSSGNLYGFEVTADSTLSAAAWWLMVYNATSAPADGAVTPAKCYGFPAGTTSFTAGFTQPAYFSTGIVLGVSTNGCFTKAASTHAFISADVQ